ncbi:DUF397 domain-containing protein [Micromonospora matsumotoense]|uniref:DUF397 domain-containing protein n=1 Tax=Micromonospora matsumotoense TaxID=121616 RepID=UPI0034137816
MGGVLPTHEVLSQASVATAPALVSGLWRCDDAVVDLVLGLLADIAAGFKEDESWSSPRSSGRSRTRRPPGWPAPRGGAGRAACRGPAVGGAVDVRDTKDRSGPALAFDGRSWASFLTSLKSTRRADTSRADYPAALAARADLAPRFGGSTFWAVGAGVRWMPGSSPWLRGRPER